MSLRSPYSPHSLPPTQTLSYLLRLSALASSTRTACQNLLSCSEWLSLPPAYASRPSLGRASPRSASTMARKPPPSTASTTSTDDQPEATSTSRQTAYQHPSRRISTPIRTSPLLKSSYGAPPDSFNPPGSSLRMSTSTHSESVAGSTRGSLGGGGSEDSDGESRVGESASVRYVLTGELVLSYRPAPPLRSFHSPSPDTSTFSPRLLTHL